MSQHRRPMLVSQACEFQEHGEMFTPIDTRLHTKGQEEVLHSFFTASQCTVNLDYNYTQATEYHKRPHKCPQCGKGFRRPVDVQRHLRVHTGERPFSCETCGRKFKQLEHVNAHMRIHERNANTLSDVIDL